MSELTLREAILKALATHTNMDNVDVCIKTNQLLDTDYSHGIILDELRTLVKEGYVSHTQPYNHRYNLVPGMVLHG